MADKSGEIDIRGINVDKLAKGFADENIILKSFLTVSTTNAREIRWFSKTAGFLGSTDSTGITAEQIDNQSFKSRPTVVEPSWTRNTSYVKKFFVESPLISIEDVKDTDIDILATMVRDLVRAVERRVEKRCYDVLTVSDVGTGENTVAVTEEWDDTTNAIAVNDLLEGKQKIKDYNYNTDGLVLMCKPDCERFLLNHIISVKGSSIPAVASEKAKSGILMQFLGIRIYTSSVVTSDKAVMFVPQKAATWKSFMPITSVVIDDPGIGKKIRVWEEGECILTDPRAVCYYSNVGPS